MKLKLPFFLFLSIIFFQLNAQSEIDIIKAYLEQGISKNLISTDDLADLDISSQHFSKSTNV